MRAGHRAGEARRRIVRLLAEHPGWTDDRIADAAGSGGCYVGRVRRRLQAAREIEPMPYVVGRTGRVFCRVARGKDGAPIRRRLCDLRHLLNWLESPDWRAAPPELRREFWITAERLCEQAGRSIDRVTGKMHKARSG